MPWDFYQQLITTGTLHIVAASGYHVTVVARVVMGVLLLLMSRKWAVVGGCIAILIYVVLAGGSAAVIRAGVMGSLALIGYLWGRPGEAKRLLWVAAGGMLLHDPLLALDIGFQLSVAATVGLLYLEPMIRGYGEKRLGEGRIKQYLKECWWPTLAATIVTTPVTMYWFGRVSLIGPVVNLLVLPLTPLVMLLSVLAVGAGPVVPFLGQIISYLLYIPLWVMVEVIKWWG